MVMRIFKRSINFVGILSATIALASLGANATVFLDVSGGQLLGAKNVLVDGITYDISFLPGNCIVVFNGCNSSDNFEFSNAEEANAAGQSLLDQVFVDDFSALGLFDSEPILTNVCANIGVCSVVIPHTVTGTNVIGVFVDNCREDSGSCSDKITDPAFFKQLAFFHLRLTFLQGFPSLRFLHPRHYPYT
jgi:hypothetical protein